MIWKIQKKSRLNCERYGKYGRKISWIVKRFGKYRRTWWNDIGNMEVVMWSDMKNMEEK
jgi:hypothetical protein